MRAEIILIFFKIMKKKAVQCQECGSLNIVRNYCKKRFHSKWKEKISDAEWRIADRILFEKISMAGIAGAVSISKRWLQDYVKKTQ
ncbi:hypothetical protein [Candidatus Electronema sp. JM]|uniref:hypothetical protein n=1 Tax=Candidatus Electronema sp. JM TaxID=3401571 RepID=UPI003AA93F82